MRGGDEHWETMKVIGDPPIHPHHEFNQNRGEPHGPVRCTLFTCIGARERLLVTFTPSNLVQTKNCSQLGPEELVRIDFLPPPLESNVVTVRECGHRRRDGLRRLTAPHSPQRPPRSLPCGKQSIQRFPVARRAPLCIVLRNRSRPRLGRNRRAASHGWGNRTHAQRPRKGGCGTSSRIPVPLIVVGTPRRSSRPRCQPRPPHRANKRPPSRRRRRRPFRRRPRR